MINLFEVTIEVTQQCPNRCIYCSSLSGMDKSEALDYETICGIVDDAAALGAKQINISGGEPLIRQDIADILAYTHSKGLMVRLYSSGICFDGTYKSVPKDLLESIKDNVDCIIFNYESSTPELYAKIMGTVPENLYLLEDTIRTSLSLGITVETHIVPMRCNFKQIPDTVERLYSMGVSNVSVLRLVPQGRVVENQKDVILSDGEAEDVRCMLTTLSQKYTEQLRLGKPYRSEKFTSCNTGTIRLAVRYDGYVFPCGAFKDGFMMFDDCAPENVKEKSLRCIYEKSQYIANIRKGLQEYYLGEVIEPCFGQYCRKIKNYV